MRLPTRILMTLVACLTLFGADAALAGSKERALDNTLRTYAATIRWGDIERAQEFLDPAWRQAHPLSALDLARYRQVRVTGYNEQGPQPVGKNEVRQVVEIGLANVNTQVARSIIDRQVWRWDEKAKRWWLTSGLPDITRHD